MNNQKQSIFREKAIHHYQEKNELKESFDPTFTHRFKYIWLSIIFLLVINIFLWAVVYLSAVQ